MIANASLLGFGLAFVVMSIGLSLFAGVIMRLLGVRLRLMGCAVERCAASLSLLIPPLLALLMVSILAARSWQEGWSTPGDHCLHHPHHAHLCLLHGDAWGQHAWTWAVAAGGALLVLRQCLAWLHAAVRVAALLRHLEPSAQTEFIGKFRVWQVPTQRPFCFVTGLWRPRIVWSISARELLTQSERHAVLSHETAHVANGDLWRRALLGLAVTLGAPLISRQIFGVWERATERLCDRLAADSVGDAAVVASALVKLARGGAVPVAGAASFLSTCSITERVQALLDRSGSGEQSARRLLLVALTVFVLVLPLLAALSDPLHHALETLLGTV